MMNRGKVLACQREVDEARWHLSRLLWEVFTHKLYKDWTNGLSGEKYGSFKEYVVAELGMSVRTAQYLVSFRNWMEELPPSVKVKAQELGLTRLMDLKREDVNDDVLQEHLLKASACYRAAVDDEKLRLEMDRTARLEELGKRVGDSVPSMVDREGILKWLMDNWSTLSEFLELYVEVRRERGDVRG